LRFSKHKTKSPTAHCASGQGRGLNILVFKHALAVFMILKTVATARIMRPQAGDQIGAMT
jgi:hypothetical protein